MTEDLISDLDKSGNSDEFTQSTITIGYEHINQVRQHFMILWKRGNEIKTLEDLFSDNSENGLRTRICGIKE